VVEGGGEKHAIDAHTSMPEVFVSYASQDTAIANAIVAALERHGVKCWIAPRNVIPGALYADEIIRSINGAKALVVVLSASAVASPHVGKEIERASSKRRPIITFRTDAAPLTSALEYFLSESQWIDIGADGTEAAFAKLMAAVQRHLTPTSTEEPKQHGGTAQQVSEPPRRPPASARPNRRLNHPLVAIISAVIAVIGAYLVMDKLWLSKHVAHGTSPAAVAPPATPAPAAISEKSVAVLPFVDMSERHNQEYFVDGLSEELIDHLARNRDLMVIGRTSSFQFKGKNEDMRSIGQQLGVATLLEGSVRTSGKNLRVTAQLIKVSTGSHLWSQTYDRTMGDIFKVQDEIASAVVTALQAAIDPHTTISGDNSSNIEAYNYFLRGRYFLQKNTQQDYDRALKAFQQAIRLDPQYAAAWAETARTYNELGKSGWMPPKEAYIKARQAVDRALSIDPNLAVGHSVLVALESNFLFDFDAARKELNLARKLDPSLDDLINAEGVDALRTGRVDDAVNTFRQATKRDPLNTRWWDGLTSALLGAGRLTEAESAARTSIELNPTSNGAHCDLGEVLLAKKATAAALAVMSAEPNSDTRITCMTDVLWALGRRAESDALLEQVKAKFADTQATSIAESYALRNDSDEAFKWLNRAYENREPYVSVVRADPAFQNLRGDPRLADLLRKMNLAK
jgi:TolB-like protein